MREGPEEINRTEIDGIPTFWADAPGPFQGSLIFRCGRADEALRSGGISHMTEHLAIYPFDRLPHAHGGFVDDTRTVFHATGEPDEVGAYLSDICRNLGELPVERLGSERRVLEAEDESSGQTHPAWHLRFGPSGYGLVGYREYGLQTVDPDEILCWSKQRYNRSNCALWFSGRPPENLELGLPAGERFAPPEPRSMGSLDWPVWATSNDGSVSISYLCSRESGMSALVSIMIERMQDHLRRELGLSYSVGGSYWRMSAETAHVIVGADCAPGHGQAVRDGMLGVLDGFAADGPDQADISHYVSLADRYMPDPQGIPSRLDTYASDKLAGAETPSNEAISAELAEMTPESLAAGLRPCLEELLVLVPAGLGLDRERARPYRFTSSDEKLDGYRLAADEDKADGIVVSSEGASQTAGGETQTIRYTDAELVALEGDYGLRLIASDGEVLWLRYRGKDARNEIRRRVEEAVPADRLVRINQHVAERRPKIEALASAQIGDADGWAVAVLPEVLFQDESVELLARGKLNGGEEGLIALTGLRLLMLDDAGERLLVEVAREQVSRAEGLAGLLKGSLEIRLEDAGFKLEAVSPRSRAKEIAAALSGR